MAQSRKRSTSSCALTVTGSSAAKTENIAVAITNPAHKDLLAILLQEAQDFDIHLMFNDPQTVLKVVLEYDLSEDEEYVYHFEPMIAGNC
jgi:hypothetical protein